MGLLKSIGKSRSGQATVAWMAATLLRLTRHTMPWTIERSSAAEAIVASGKPFIACFWHGRFGTMRSAWQSEPARFHMLISGHRDGVLIARGMTRLGFGTIAGSSRRGGASAMRSMQQVLARGDCVGITPDGPRGPRMRAKAGAIKAAQLAQVPILPVSASATHCSFLKTWDRFCFIKPFGRGLILFGEPIVVPRRAEKEELEALRQDLERQLNWLTAEADRRCNQAPIEPAPVPAPKAKAEAAPGGGPDAVATGSRKIRHAGA